MLNYKFNGDSWIFNLETDDKNVNSEILNNFQILEISRQYIVEDMENSTPNKSLFFSPILNDDYEWNISLYWNKWILSINNKCEFKNTLLKSDLKGNKNYRSNLRVLVFWLMNGKVSVINCSEGNYSEIKNFISSHTWTYLFPFCCFKWEEKTSFNWKKYFKLLIKSELNWKLPTLREEIKNGILNIKEYIENRNNEILQTISHKGSPIIQDFHERINAFVNGKNSGRPVMIEDDFIC